MPKLKKRSAGIGARRKYHYKSNQENAFDSLEGRYTKLDSDSPPDATAVKTSSPQQSVWSNTTTQTDLTDVAHICTQTQSSHEHDYALPPSEHDIIDNSHENNDIHDILHDHVASECEDNVDIGLEEVTIASQTYEQLVCELKQFEWTKTYTLVPHNTSFHLVKFYTGANPSVKIRVNREFMCQVKVHEKEIPRTHAIWTNVPELCDTVQSVSKLIENIEGFRLCSGNSEEEFQTLVHVGGTLGRGTEVEVEAYREGDFGAGYQSTIRSVKCPVLTDRRTKCLECASFGYVLKKRSDRAKNRSTDDIVFHHSSYKHKHMSRNELCRKINQQKTEINSLQHEVWKLKREISQEIQKKGVTVQKHEHKELSELMAVCTPEFQKAFPDSNSRQRLFWEQQMDHHQKPDSRGMRWHPMIIRWCLYIRSKSEKAYEAMRESGFINLPSNRTLFDYSHFLTNQLGFQADVFRAAYSQAKSCGLYDETSPWKCNVGLLFDEIKIKEDLVYDKHSGELIGYCNLGDIGNQMLAYENVQSDKAQELAKYMLVIMVRSVCSSFLFPLCAFATKCTSADFLYPILWKTVSAIEIHLKLNVLFFTCDGATPNRKFYQMHRVGNEEFVYKTLNPYDPTRHVYFISDVPHLIKTIRNNFSNSFAHTKTRSLWKNNKDISWMHIVKLFEEHCELNLYNPCPKLTRKHIDLQAFSYMKVNLAAQVISDSVANALEMLYGDEMSETVFFIRTFNKFFDCLNVRSVWEGRNKRNPNLEPYSSTDDPRLTFLTTDLPTYLREWQNGVNKRPGMLSKANRASMLLSHQTVRGIKISCASISECVKDLLNQGAKYVLTHSFNQDPLEQHFGHYRHKSGANNNPSVYEVRNTLTTLRAVKSQAIAPKRGNVKRHLMDKENVDHSKLQRRR